MTQLLRGLVSFATRTSIRILGCLCFACLIAAFLTACGGDKPADKSAPPNADGSGTSPPAAPTTAAAARVSVLTTIRRYERAFNTHDLGQLDVILADSVRTKGGGPGACASTVGRGGTLSSYRALFASKTQRLRIEGATRSAVHLDSYRATAALRYRDGSNTRPIRFDFIRGGGTWRIGRIAADCGAKGESAPPPLHSARPPSRRPNVVHPRPGCTVVLTPIKPGPHSPRHPQAPNKKALESLCASAADAPRR